MTLRRSTALAAAGSRTGKLASFTRQPHQAAIPTAGPHHLPPPRELLDADEDGLRLVILFSIVLLQLGAVDTLQQQLPRVKDGPDKAPRTCSHGGNLVINERHTPSPPHGYIRVVRPKTKPDTGGPSSRKPKKEPAWSVSRDREDFPGLKVAEQNSFNYVVPTDLDFALAWSKAEHEWEEAERAARRSGSRRPRRRHCPRWQR